MEKVLPILVLPAVAGVIGLAFYMGAFSTDNSTPDTSFVDRAFSGGKRKTKRRHRKGK